jgi:hypothetical protein
MSHLSDVEVLYELMGASHIPYREIKLEEAKALSNALWPLLNEIDLSKIEIPPVTMMEKGESLLTDKFSIKHELVEPLSFTAVTSEPFSAIGIFNITEPVNALDQTGLLATSTKFYINADISINKEVPFNSVSSAPESVIASIVLDEVRLEELPVETNNTIADIQANTLSVAQAPDQARAQRAQDSANINSEMSTLLLRIKHHAERDKTISKQSFFERLQA